MFNPCSNSSKQRKPHFIPPVSQSFPSMKATQSSQNQSLQQWPWGTHPTHSIELLCRQAWAQAINFCVPENPVPHAQLSSILPGSSLCVGASATFLPLQETPCLGQAHLQNISEPPSEITDYSVCLADFATSPPQGRKASGRQPCCGTNMKQLHSHVLAETW